MSFVLFSHRSNKSYRSMKPGRDVKEKNEPYSITEASLEKYFFAKTPKELVQFAYISFILMIIIEWSKSSLSLRICLNYLLYHDFIHMSYPATSIVESIYKLVCFIQLHKRDKESLGVSNFASTFPYENKWRKNIAQWQRDWNPWKNYFV